LDPGNGAAGVALKALMPHLPLQADYLREEPDGNFPNGVPNPILPESRAMTEAKMRGDSPVGDDEIGGTSHRAVGSIDASHEELQDQPAYDFGVAWDGDYDRCFLFDERGNFIEGYYIVGLIAHALSSTILVKPSFTTLDSCGTPSTSSREWAAERWNAKAGTRLSKKKCGPRTRCTAAR
jgi:Phosphomannomutase